ncbi:MAG: hypothetical protein AAFO03_25805, partial [Bacteroidota bacterium]
LSIRERSKDFIRVFPLVQSSDLAASRAHTCCPISGQRTIMTNMSTAQSLAITGIVFRLGSASSWC